MDDVVQEFLIESHENLDQLDQDLVSLESDPGNHDLLGSIFRTIHTIKGTTGFLGFEKLESLTHGAENLLSRLRDGEMTLDPEIATALLGTVDAVREMLAHIEADGTEGEGHYGPLIETLTRLQEAQRDGDADRENDENGANKENDEGDSEPPRFGEVLVQSGKVSPSDIDAAVAAQTGGDPRHLGEILVERGAVGPDDVVDTLRAQDAAGSSISDSTIRVDVSLLDDLMNLVSELVLARNQIIQYTVTQEDNVFLSTSQRLNLITTELQEGVMKTRMQPIGNLWSKFPRVVRDLAVSCGKQVRIEMEGQETELDKTIIEAIKDPLTHLVRNSVDHGIENPDARSAAGKAAEGRLLMRAFHEGGQVNIEISDDGKGIDPESVKTKAVANGQLSADQAARMSDREALGLVFLPGLSTAATVTNVSGRGVGMDVVKTNIEKIGGTVDVSSRPGRGTTFWIKIPLTLAIIPALMVGCDGDRFAIPQVSLLELVRLEGEEARRGVETIHGVPVYRLRGRLLPIIELHRELEVERDDAEADVLNIVVLQSDDRQFGLVVDEIADTEEIVVKPLSKQLKDIPVFAGATIMGDGRVALILDVVGLAEKAGLISERHDAARLGAVDESAVTGDRRTLLVFQLGAGRRMAVPLDAVARLEEFEVGAVERAGEREVVQYRGGLLPLAHLSDCFGSDVFGLERSPRDDARALDDLAALDADTGDGGASSHDDEALHVVVHEGTDAALGLVVDEILDIVEETVVVDPVSAGPGVLGAAVVQGRVTDLLDVDGVVALVTAIDREPALGAQRPGAGGAESGEGPERSRPAAHALSGSEV